MRPAPVTQADLSKATVWQGDPTLVVTRQGDNVVIQVAPYGKITYDKKSAVALGEKILELANETEQAVPGESAEEQ
jgi:hypothetical protein